MKLEIAATRANLMSVKETLAMAQEGYDLLSQKREVLLTELLHLVNDVKRVRAETAVAVKRAYASLGKTLSHTGSDGATRLTQGCQDRVEVSVRERSVMGVPVPLLNVKSLSRGPMWGLGELPIIVDDMVERFRHLLVVLSEQAEIETTVWRLIRE